MATDGVEGSLNSSTPSLSHLNLILSRTRSLLTTVAILEMRLRNAKDTVRPTLQETLADIHPLELDEGFYFLVKVSTTYDPQFGLKSLPSNSRTEVPSGYVPQTANGVVGLFSTKV